jgi:hypothetical protein
MNLTIPSLTVADALHKFPTDKVIGFSKFDMAFKNAMLADIEKPMTMEQFTFRSILDYCEKVELPVRERVQILISQDFEYMSQAIADGSRSAKLSDKGEIL